MFKVCGHCDKTLGAKAYKEHRRRYFHDGSWMRTEFVDTRSVLPHLLTSPRLSVPCQIFHLISSLLIKIGVKVKMKVFKALYLLTLDVLNFDGNVSDSASGDNIGKEMESVATMPVSYIAD